MFDPNLADRACFHELIFLCIFSKMNFRIFERVDGARDVYAEVYRKTISRVADLIKYKFDSFKGFLHTNEEFLNDKSLLDWIRIGELDELMATESMQHYVRELSNGAFPASGNGLLF